ncbi:hypothetical protein SAMN05660199_02349 [Klenkia soli]|uniref:MmpS family membrane protein n=1 Tax=Klenkia soli TaxID=1052260 RepID=A0A1H0L6K6_9ACTN|nr:hypothetical protein [Klenkia soli]SDO63884.1 hypothetical protein SAMN05660199_02349 [Klenkia soli]
MRRSALLAPALLLLAACGGAGGTDGGGDKEVVYTLESDAPTMLATYATATNGSIGQQQEAGVPSPWTVTTSVPDDLFSSSALVLNGSMEPVLDGSVPDGTTITCRITVDGEVVAEQTSTGQYVSATCSSAA